MEDVMEDVTSGEPPGVGKTDGVGLTDAAAEVEGSTGAGEAEAEAAAGEAEAAAGESDGDGDTPLAAGVIEGDGWPGEIEALAVLAVLALRDIVRVAVGVGGTGKKLE